MFLLLIILNLLPSVHAQADVDYYIKKFRYQAMPLPVKNKALYNLGFKLFYDKNLSGKNNISCQSCHSLKGYSGDTLPLGVGEGAVGVAYERRQEDGLILKRHTPPIFNLGASDVRSLFWDGRVRKNFDGEWITPTPLTPEVSKTLTSLLAVQSLFPFASPEEMLGKESTLSPQLAWNQVMTKIFKGPFQGTYKKLFQEAFPDAKSFNIGHVGNALAELMEHHFKGNNTLWDLYLRGRKEVLSERMKRGAVLFHTKANCIFCHSGNHFTTWGFQNIAPPQVGSNDLGRYEVTKNINDMYKFRVPPLRNVAVTAPYMHSGVFKTLWEVIDHYDNPIQSNRNFRWDPRISNYLDPLNLDTDSTNQDNRERTLSPMLARMLDLSQEEKTDLFCFLAVALTDVSYQMDLKQKGIVNEVSDCSPRPYYF